MAILSNPEATVPEKVPASGRVKSVNYRTAAVESKFTPLASLLTRIEGSSLVGIYYNQVVERDDQIRPQQVGLDAPYQQYNRINKFETKLQGNLSFDVDEGRQERSLRASLVIYPSIVPLHGDMYIFDTGDGALSVFTVRAVTPLSWMRQTCYRLELFKTSNLTEEIQKDLDEKTIERYTFIRDFVNHGKYPIIVDEIFRSYSDMGRMFKTMQSEYLRNFFSEVCQTLLVPGQPWTLYDPFLAKTVLAVLEVGEHPLARKINLFHLDNDYAFRTTTVWDSLLQVEESHLHVAAHYLKAASTRVVYSRALQGGPYWSQIQRLMFPVDDRQDADARLTRSNMGTTTRLQRSEAPLTDFHRLAHEKDLRAVEVINTEEVPPGYTTPDIHRVADYETYVFSPAFYDKDLAKMSRLEKMVWSLLDHEELDVHELARLVGSSKLWDKLERFYYVPVLMILCTVALRGPSGAS